MYTQTYVNESWQIQEGNPDPAIDWAESKSTPNGEVIVVGNTINSSQMANVFLIKYDEEGNKDWEVEYNGPSSSNDYGTGVEVDSQGYIYISGTTFNTVYNSFDFVVLKYSPNGICNGSIYTTLTMVTIFQRI